MAKQFDSFYGALTAGIVGLCFLGGAVGINYFFMYLEIFVSWAIHG